MPNFSFTPKIHPKIKKHLYLSAIVFGLLMIVGVFVKGYLIPVLQTYYTFNLNTFDYAILYEGVLRFFSKDSTFLFSRGVFALADNQEYLQFFWFWIFLFPNPHLAILASHSLIFLISPLVILFQYLKKSPVISLILFVAFLFHPVPFRMSSDIVHAEAFNFISVPFFLIFLFKRQWLPAMFAALMISLAKEDSCLYLVYFMLVYIAFNFRKPDRRLKESLLLLAIPAVVFLINYTLVLPHYLQETCKAMGLMLSPDSVRPVNVWFDPLIYAENKFIYIFEQLIRREAFVYYLMSFWPLLFYRRKYLWLGLAASGQILLNTVSAIHYLMSQTFHYDHFAFPVIWFGLVVSIFDSSGAKQKFFQKPAFKAVTVLLISFWCAKTFDFMGFPSLWYNLQDTVRLSPDDTVTELQVLTEQIPNRIISADYISLPYLLKSGRYVFMFKNPFVTNDFGTSACNKPPQKPEIVVLSNLFTNEQNIQILTENAYVRDPKYMNFNSLQVWQSPAAP